MKAPDYDHDQTTDPPVFTPGDIYFILFRHKWKIILLFLAGVAAAAAYWWFCPPPYQSEARLFIRYVIDNHALNADPQKTQTTSPDEMGQSIINSEMEILTSFDLAKEAAKNIGPDKILAKYGGGNDPVAAASIIKKNLIVEAPKQDSVIHVVYSDADPTIVQPVLSEIISDYLDKHLQVHESSMSDDYLSQETAQLRSQIDETEDELRAAKASAGIISLPDAEKSYTDQIGWLKSQLFEAEADLAADESELKAQPEEQPTNAAAAAPAPGLNVPEGRIEEYQRVCARLDYLENQQSQYYTQLGYTDENRLVQETQLEIAQTKWLKQSLEQRYPDLVGTYMPAAGPGQNPSTAGLESERLAPVSLQAKIGVLKQQLAESQTEAVKVDIAESKISDLQRRKEMLENNYQNFAASLEQSRIDETLGPGRVSNINTVEAPTPPYKDLSKQIKAMAMMVGGGILAGLAWAFLIEIYLDTSVRRTKEIESRLKLPLLISIPDISRNGHRRLIQAAERRQLQFQNPDDPDGGPGILSWETSSCLNPFYDALRDKLVNYFENARTIVQPKLITVTGTEKGCGVSAIAAGVATSLAETGERVLLVDMKLEHGVAQQFFLGRPCCGLDEALALETRDSALVQENLYVVTAGSPDERFQRILPRLFVSLLPRIRSSDYGYIIFDMPPVSQTSITSRLAGFMDMVLLVIQSEKTHLDAAQQAIALLAHSKTKIGVVLNKTRRYIPERLHRETLTDF
ncbi:MAG TPA: Wzz/FepE/Etk N-terminal domain-containing protein [Alphaproteobacteria bacterium]|nr:Wzz/FepE/Etk N-terminal domain-containing protein [Alphaproteobacteria bacterium]